MNKLVFLFLLLVNLTSFAAKKDQTRWLAQENPDISHNIISCQLKKNRFDFAYVEIFAKKQTVNNKVILSDITTIIGITEGGHKVLSTGGTLTVD
ncbi:MAG TPA: hypothetical protein PLJ21_13275, partial [Pseudobdellovibrionaceae bacterium]|nr:hypothetical protein [Pseudobdellovibrionaceae bacterium]